MENECWTLMRKRYGDFEIRNFGRIRNSKTKKMKILYQDSRGRFYFIVYDTWHEGTRKIAAFRTRFYTNI